MSPSHGLPNEPGASGFSERDFYLAEFRGRTLAFAMPSAPPDGLADFESVLGVLEANRTRVIVLSSDRALLEKIAGDRVLDAADPRWIGRLWRAIRGDVRVAIAVPDGESLASACRRVVLRLRLAKLIWIDDEGPLKDADGERISLLDGTGVEALLTGDARGWGNARRLLLGEIRTMVEGGLPAVNLCSLAGLADDLFTFEGSGTFFARERYLDVRRLSLDEFDAADRLIRRGVEEGYLVERGPDQLEEILANAFGVFVEGRYLAGVGALLPHAGEPGASGELGTSGEPGCGEIGSLYTLTRFLGEGVGAHLVNFALECAAEQGFPYVFACTTSERVQTFFERHGFRVVGPDEIPREKWQGYPEERRARVRCVRCDLESSPSHPS
jgi:N-acetylglutamate synthase-like GNAT family acetyltransferase